MKHYRIVKVQYKNTFFIIQKKGIFGWRDLRTARVTTSGAPFSKLITFESEQDAENYIINKQTSLKRFVLKEFYFKR